MQYTVIYNKTTNRWEPHQRAKEGDTWEQCVTYAFASRLPLAFETRDLALGWIRVQLGYAQQDGFAAETNEDDVCPTCGKKLSGEYDYGGCPDCFQV